MLRNTLARTLLALSSLCFSGTAQALPEYPKQLQTAADTPCLPHCSVCHRDDNAGSGTVDRPFGRSIEASGLGGGGGVARAIDRMRSKGTDSDGDGVSDVDELGQGQDPNYSGDSSLCGPEVGCSAARRGGSVAWLWSALLVIAFALAERRFGIARGRLSSR